MSAHVLGDPRSADVLLVLDHGSAKLPEEVDIGLSAEQMRRHIAYDIGTYEVAELMSARPGFAAISALWSRLLVDTNRCATDAAVIPIKSDGHDIPGNVLCDEGRAARLERYHAPYHEAVSDLIDETQPKLLIFLHSFTPQMAGLDAQPRPWHVGLLYNDDRRAADVAMDFLASEGLCVGDQQPYSGLAYNYSFVRHAERRGLPYILFEIRQDLIDNPQGQEDFADLTYRLTNEILEKLA